MPTSKAQFLPLTSIRFFLALWVVIFHQTLHLPAESFSHFPAVVFCWDRTGYQAVSVFFVLSGFILSYNYSLAHAWSSPQLARYAVARFARIYPTYCIGLVLIAPFVVVPVVQHIWHTTLREQTVVALMNLTLLQSWIPRFAPSWNSPGWSLSAEAFFYCCFPFVGVALWKVSRVRSLVIAGSLIWAAALIIPLLAVGIPLRGFGDAPATSLLPDADRFWTNLVKFNPLLRFPDFCIGIVLFRAYDLLRGRNGTLLGRGYYLYVPGVLLELVATSYCNSIRYPLVHNGLFLPLHALVILGFAFGGGIPARVLSVRPLVFLGGASYSMYILHEPISWWMYQICKRLFSTEWANSFVWSSAGGVGLYILVVICLSAIVFKFFEQPANRFVKRLLTSRLEPSPRKTAATAFAG